MARCWFIYWDACGLTCFIVGIGTVSLVNYVTIFQIIAPWFRWATWASYAHAILFQFMVINIFISYIKAATTDPGSVEKGTASEADIIPPMTDAEKAINLKMKRRYCQKCKCIKPPRAHHCSTCHRCINKMDHHCPWVNNCVGSNNMKYFLLFLFWTFLGSTYAAVMAIWRAYSCYKSRYCVVPQTSMLILIVFSTVMAIFFAIFVVAMMWDQYTGVTTDTTAIEAMKCWDETQRGLQEGLTDTCGEPCGWRWFFPVALSKNSTAFYKWSPKDDPDAYDVRDPIAQRHMQRVRHFAAKLDAARMLAEAEASGGTFTHSNQYTSGVSLSDSSEIENDSEDESEDRSGSEEDDDDESDEESTDDRSPSPVVVKQTIKNKSAVRAASAAATSAPISKTVHIDPSTINSGLKQRVVQQSNTTKTTTATLTNNGTGVRGRGRK